MSLIVQKFGGSSVRDAQRIRNVAGIIAETYLEGNDVLVVLSAQGDTTDDLIAKAEEINSHPSKREMDMLLSTGEQISVALCAMALESMGLPCVSLTAWQVGIQTTAVHGDARIKRIDSERVQAELDQHRIVLITGFQGMDRAGDVTTLGRGGSDTSAVALAAAFQIFYDGEYTTPHLYTRVLDRDGNIYLENNATSYQALTPQTAYIMNRLLKNVLYSNVGTASGRYPNSNGMESFGKTGTASDEKDLWFVGGTPYYVTAVWWGYDAPYDMTNTLGKNQAKTRTCVTAWKAYMEQVQANLPYKAFPTSDGVVERAYCTQSGLLAGAGCPSTAVGYYRADDLPDTCTYSHAAPQAAVSTENTDDAVPTQPVVPTDTSALDTE